MARRKALWCVLAVVAVLVAIVSWRASSPFAQPDRRIGLFTSLPILWNEAAALDELLDAKDQPHWARAVLEDRGTVVPLDTLLDLAHIDVLMVAQPRPLAPDENVALDAWLRGGGRLLLFADPMLTEESAFPLGDRRRPQDVVLISPILARWGLQLRFDDAQPSGERESAGEHVPVNLSGEFGLVAGGHDAACLIGQNGLIARCQVGKGRAVLVADAALLERAANGGARISALRRLFDEAAAD
ncbi:ABC transporter [Novosphingobium sp. ERN07]|uniref:DUF4350 domain-containing protein n=1 Tax=Novosphingobium sp. ERN07 TaxID=2726187 RepID=UPI001456D084|nr:DUF4350 domain-containing protein [Novosphingobium sp. ERN07]NLR70699.1 ABC transporter [Novosphingobium sp. ERN07]